MSTDDLILPSSPEIQDEDRWSYDKVTQVTTLHTTFDFQPPSPVIEQYFYPKQKSKSFKPTISSDSLYRMINVI